MDKKPADCTCQYPVIRFRNMTGHAPECPAHHRWLAEHAKPTEPARKLTYFVSYSIERMREVEGCPPIQFCCTTITRDQPIRGLSDVSEIEKSLMADFIGEKPCIDILFWRRYEEDL